ncbi:amino acid adenylation domain-containing protein [Kitasatospora sp. NPDC085895]|uniref:amino acid adenylation domain-containing protein n=1 Tax=Kitasatospora sp. NPDC085895 TaxID=3155057 RepID=UPI00344F7213
MSLLTAVLRHADLRPDTIAVTDGTGAWSYRELVHRARALAAGYREAGVTAGGRVVLLLPPGREAVAAALAAFWTGAAYVPVDPVQPAGRLRAMLEDCAPQLVVGQTPAAADGPSSTVRSVSSLLSPAPAGEAAAGADDDLAYIVHTSGSTGRPKGVMVEHGSVLNLIDELDVRAPVPDGWTGSWWCSPDFDVAVWEQWAPLVRGGTLCVVPAAERLDPRRFLAFLDREAVGSCYVPPSFLTVLRDRLRDEPESGGSLRRVLVGVEPIPLGLLQEIKALRPGLQIVNGYGPAETTVCCTLYVVPDGPGESAGRTPIGTAVTGNLLRIIGPDGRPAADGAGELLIGGAGVARGYVAATAEQHGRFDPPEAGTGTERWYRTGDLVRTLPDGNLEYLGRADRQLKLRGYRVEPAEVEFALRSVLPVREVVVDQRDLPGIGPALVAYVVADAAFSADRVRQRLRGLLPVYAVPSRLVAVAELPLTRNGKVDRDALRERPLDDVPETAPGLPAGALAEGADGQAVAKEIDGQAVALVWARILRTAEVPDPGLGFVDLGGASLGAVRAAAELETLTGQAVSAADVLHAVSATELAQRLRGTRAEEPAQPSGTTGRIDGELSVNQLGIWLHDLTEPLQSAYLEPVCFELNGPLDIDRLTRAVRRAAAAHLSFGAVIEDEDGDGGPVMRLGRHTVEPVEIEIPEGTDRAGVQALLRAEATAPMALDEGPLMRCRLFRLAPDRALLLFVWHHLVADGWSVRLFLDELAACYRDVGRVAQAPAVTVCDLNARQNAELGTPAAGARLRRAAARLAGAPAEAFPSAHAAGAAARRGGRAGAGPGAVQRLQLAGGFGADLAKAARGRGLTPFVLVSAAYRLAAAEALGLGEFLLGCATSGRRHPDAMAVAGCLINTVLMRFGPLPPARDDLLQDTAREIERALSAQEDLPFAALVARMRQADRTLPKRMPQLYLSVDDDYPLTLPGLDCRVVPVDPHRAKFDATLVLRMSPAEVSGVFEHLLDSVGRDRAEHFVDAFRRHLRDLAGHSSTHKEEERQWTS